MSSLCGRMIKVLTLTPVFLATQNSAKWAAFHVIYQQATSGLMPSEQE